MIFHTVLFNFVENVTSENIQGLEDALRADVANFPQVTFYACGRDLGVSAGSDQFAIVAGAETAKDLEDYLNDPGHKAIAAEWKHFVATRHAVEFESKKYLND
ncbi:Dabb family protein [Aurantimicrobium minutum]|uniref:Dabb family protein n=1 Tax=Aurantimicrobium minutum TaxID=708131 RepID=UPI0024738D8A|nr:Dabb family protein [Aurantimicrobium minutum]MDH6207110.1 hypothetical protein [Aurantimicrobium minutum]